MTTDDTPPDTPDDELRQDPEHVAPDDERQDDTAHGGGFVDAVRSWAEGRARDRARWAESRARGRARWACARDLVVRYPRTALVCAAVLCALFALGAVLNAVESEPTPTPTTTTTREPTRSEPPPTTRATPRSCDELLAGKTRAEVEEIATLALLAADETTGRERAGVREIARCAIAALS